MKRLPLFALAVAFGACPVAPVTRAQSGVSTQTAVADGERARLDDLLRGVRGRVREYHARLFSVQFTETVRRQELRGDESPKGKEREFVFESVVARRPGREGRESPPVMTRRLKVVDGKPAPPEKPPAPDGAKPPKKCGGYTLDPPRAYGDRLSFLLPEFQPDYVFSHGGEEEFEGRRVAVLVASMPPADAPPELRFEGNCFFLSRPLRHEARVLVDPETYDVLQVSWRLAETFSAKTGTRVVRKGLLFRPSPSRELSYEKIESKTAFRPVTFDGPRETLLLPVSSESLYLIRGARHPGTRTRESYTNYKRFLTSVDVRETDDDAEPPPASR